MIYGNPPDDYTPPLSPSARRDMFAAAVLGGLGADVYDLTVNSARCIVDSVDLLIAELDRASSQK